MTMSDEHTAKDSTLYLFVKLIVQELRDGEGGDLNAAKSRAPDEKPGSPGSAKEQ
jgi:hypothetical protein